MKVLRLIFLSMSSTLRQKRSFLKQKDMKHIPWLRHFVLLILSLFAFLTGCATTTKLVSPTTYNEDLSQFSRKAVSTPYQTYTGERLSRDKTAIIAVSAHMMTTDKEGIGIHNLSINNYKINFMNDIDNRPKYYQLEILPGKNCLETKIKWFYKPMSYDYIGTSKLTFNAKAGATYFLQIYEKRPPKEPSAPNAVLDFFFGVLGQATFPLIPLWSLAVDDEGAYVAPRFVWIWDVQTEHIVAGVAPSSWGNNQSSNTK